ncbi:MAG: hypothetical protein AAF462_06255 [Thermodesulfobacteriota bacterium]
MKLVLKLSIIAVFSVSILLASCSAEKSSAEFPPSCTESGFTYEDNNLVLNEATSDENVYLINNSSASQIMINIPPKKDPGADAGWSSMLGANKWSAIAISTENFKFSCYNLPSSGGEENLNCKEVLSVCKFKQADLGSAGSGSFWLAEDKPLNGILATMKSRGVSWE